MKVFAFRAMRGASSVPAEISISHADLRRAMRSDQPRLRSMLRRIEARRKKGQPVDRSLSKLSAELASSVRRREQRLNSRPRIRYPEELPISARRGEIAKAIEANQVVVICGETGSGKSTQLPKICLEIGRGNDGFIGHTQPRRIAARSIASRVAHELDSSLGRHVGYKVRFTDHTRPECFIKVMTDGILLAETQGDRSLSQYDTLIIDEAHERSLNIDFLLGYLKELLPRRRDLKVIITSATIDPRRFSEHFGNAPVIEVSGRTYPVEVRYRPLETDDPDEEDREMEDAVVDAVDELAREDVNRPGDVLVFCSGEREIRQYAKALSKRHPDNTEILPLFARLSSADQMKVFKPHKGRRIVLATNVAETSLTVPGIRYVVDTGHARISRYSARAKVQRLPIEKTSQASADQRKGRCGRMESGVCIRLYPEDDYLARDRFTAPEILRTNLASVILQMKYLGMGEIESFPFLDPPRPTAIREGYRTLHELGAIDEKGALTRIGRELAQLPVDPRIGRMILAGKEENCLKEVLIIAAALSVQDPRDRPFDKQQAADEAHARFHHEQSDFLAFLNLWTFYHERARQLSHSKLRKACQQNFLSFVRMREWHDTHHQLQELACSRGGKLNRKPADEDAIHRALLTGLLSNVGCLGDGYEYTGAGGIKFHIFPGSGLFGKPPKWIMSGELVETTRLYARTVAKIQPQWIEDLAPHLVSRTYSDPRWNEQTAHVNADEKVTLYGLVIVPRRTVHYGPIRPTEARQLFIHHALVLGEFRTNAPFFRHNRRLQEEIERLEAKARKHDVLAEEEARHNFYDQRLPADIHNGPAFEKWRKREERIAPKLLFMTRAHLLTRDTSEITEELYPDHLDIEGARLPLEYTFDGSAEHDGVTVIVPVEAFNQVTPERLDWLVPGMIKPKIVELIRSLPKHIRRCFVPAPDYADDCIARLRFGEGVLKEALARTLSSLGGIPVPRDAFSSDQIPSHLRMNIRVVDERGKMLAEGRSVASVREAVSEQIQQTLPRLDRSDFNRTGLRRWDFDELPKRVEVRRKQMVIHGYPALIDRGDCVNLQLLDSQANARFAMRPGLRRLCMLQLDGELQYQRKCLRHIDEMALHYASLGGRAQLEEQLITLIADRALFANVPDVLSIRTREQYEKLLDTAWNGISRANGEVCELINHILAAYHAVRCRLDEISAPSVRESLADANEQLKHLMPADFILASPFEWLRHYHRYLHALHLRFEKLGEGRADRDREIMQQVRAPWRAYLDRRAKHEGEGVHDPQLDAFRWMIEEYRVSLFAQQLGTCMPISKQRLEKQWGKVRM